MNNVLAKLTPYQNNLKVVSYSQSVGDIISGILATHARYRTEYDKICNQFKGQSAIIIAKKIYDFLKANTHYVIESDSRQTLRSPTAILHLGGNPKIGLDCKSYALFIGGILDALNRAGKKINWSYRFASYKMFDKLPHHVFVVINPGSKNEIFVDPVLPTFNNRKPYNFKIDKKPMALIAVAGIGRHKKTKAEKKEKRKKILNKIKKVGRILVKFNPATATARNAFLVLLKVNLLQLAVKLERLKQNGNTNQLNSFWEKIGGNVHSLNKNIDDGVRHAKKRKKMEGVGVVMAIPAAIAAATPIILKITQLLKEAGIDTSDLEKAGKKILNRVVAKKVDDMANAEDSGSTKKNNSDQSSTEESGSTEDSNDNDSMGSWFNF